MLPGKPRSLRGASIVGETNADQTAFVPVKELPIKISTLSQKLFAAAEDPKSWRFR